MGRRKEDDCMSHATLIGNPADLVRTELTAVEEALLRASASEIEIIQESARYILSSGGKRVRPQVLLLTTAALGGSLSRAVPLAAACELVHTATLVHDDIVDESDSRRGRTAVQFHIGNSASVLMGDYLVVRAFGLVAEDPDRDLWRILTETIGRMCEGEVLQIRVKGDAGLSVEVYEVVIECKTAVLMAACSQFGAMVSGASAETIRGLTSYGYNIGMAFQIQDDILDFIGCEETLGKPVAGDLREGKVTLPVIYALEDAAPDDRAELLRIYEKSARLDACEIRRATEIIESTGGFERARRHALTFIQQAQRDLDGLPESEWKDSLRVLADHIVDRRK
jgi:octaprenyl-diphosphate synthase